MPQDYRIDVWYLSMDFSPTAIPDVLLIKPRVFTDDRGFFLETFRTNLYEHAGIAQPFVQDNHSGSNKGVLRGLHYQIKRPQGKLVRVLTGSVFDVAVDLRRSSATFGNWIGTILSSEEKNQLWIPVGFAHGFYVLSDWADVLYKATDYYHPEGERTLLWNDRSVNIDWPIPKGEAPALSPKDAEGKLLEQLDLFD
jgi:dTDP-4-dehydrorhamnose 3,5-epimerase